MRIVYLLPVVSHARYHKRVAALQALGVEPRVMAFERDYYPGVPWAGGYTSLGMLQHENYYGRLVPLIKALPQVHSAVAASDVVYAFGLDMLLLGWLASSLVRKRPRIVYELGDIQSAMLGRSLCYRGLRGLERFLLGRTHLVVVTSEAFVSGYFRGIQGLTPSRYQVIENKMECGGPVVSPIPTRHSNGMSTFRVGYFGVLRCRRSWEILRRAVVKSDGRVQLYVRGIPTAIGSLDDTAEDSPHIDYGGPYLAPDDLPSMYGQVDMVWASYPYQGTGLGNWRWARTNRFYEACRFQRPMFTQAGTEDGRLVEAMGLGVSVDLADTEAAVERILQVSQADIDRWRENLASLPEQVYVLTDEHEQLIRAIE